MRGRVPDSGARGAWFGDALAPDDLPMRAAAAAANATIDRGGLGRAKTDRLLVPVWLMNTHHPRRSDTGSLPTRVVDLEFRIGDIVQFDQGEIDVHLGRAENGA